MPKTSIEEIESLYKKCGLFPGDTQEIRREINQGNLNNNLNTNFSNIYGKYNTNTFSSSTIVKDSVIDF